MINIRHINIVICIDEESDSLLLVIERVNNLVNTMILIFMYTNKNIIMNNILPFCQSIPLDATKFYKLFIRGKLTKQVL